MWMTELTKQEQVWVSCVTACIQSGDVDHLNDKFGIANECLNAFTKKFNVVPQEKPIELDDVLCPNCNHYMKLRNGKNGWFYGCPTYPTCKGVVNVTDAEINREVLTESMPAKPTAYVGVKGLENALDAVAAKHGVRQDDIDDVPF